MAGVYASRLAACTSITNERWSIRDVCTTCSLAHRSAATSLLMVNCHPNTISPGVDSGYSQGHMEGYVNGRGTCLAASNMCVYHQPVSPSTTCLFYYFVVSAISVICVRIGSLKPPLLAALLFRVVNYHRQHGFLDSRLIPVPVRHVPHPEIAQG